MVRKLIEFPLFDIVKLYKEIREKKITPFRWVTEEIEKRFPEEIIKELKPIRRKLLPLPEEELPPPELITRTIYAKSNIICCYREDAVLEPQELNMEFSETKPSFKDNLTDWVKKMTPTIEAETKTKAIAECRGMGKGVELCDDGFTFEIIEDKTTEEPASEDDINFYNTQLEEK